MCMKQEKTTNSQSNPDKENHNWNYHNSKLQAILQSCNHQDSIVAQELAHEQTHRSMKQNREPRNGHTNVWLTNL